MFLIPLHHCSVNILFAVVAIINWKSSNSAFSQINGNLVHGHVAIITETKYRYVMIESILWFNGVGVVPGLILPFFCSSKVNYAVKKAEQETAWGWATIILLQLFGSHTYSAGETVDLSGKNSFTPSEMSSAMEVV